MRTGSVTINGHEYRICLSTRVLMGLEERGLSLDSVFADNAHQITNVFALLQLMIDAGSRWAVMNGEEDPGTITLDELMDSTAVDQYSEIVASITQTVAGGRNVEATPPKKKAVNRQAQPHRG